MKAERVGQDVAEFAAHSRREQEKGFIGFAKVQVVFDEEQMDVEHRFGEVNKRPLIEKHVKQLLNNYVGQGRHDQAHPLVVMVDEDAIDKSSLCQSAIPYDRLPVLKFKANAENRVITFLNGGHRYKANEEYYVIVKKESEAAKQELSKHQKKIAAAGAQQQLDEEGHIVDPVGADLKAQDEQLQERKQETKRWLTKVFAERK